MLKFTVLTDKSTLDVEPDCRREVADQQDAILSELGYINDGKTRYKEHFFESPFFDEQTRNLVLDDAIQCLAIKDGVDLVRFENKNIGFVAYYNGHENGFEIIREGDNDLWN